MNVKKTIPKPRGKKKITEMFPIKEWLSTSEACSFLSIGETAFSQFVIDNKLTISSPFKSRKYYKVSEINKALENNIIVKGAIKL